MPGDTNGRATLLAGGEPPLVLVGPPRDVRGEFRVQNTTERKVIVRKPLLKTATATGGRGARKAATSLPDAGMTLRRIVVRAGTSKPVPLALTLDPRTPPGTYHAELDVNGEQQAVVMHVTEDVALHISPSELVLANTPGRKIQKEIVITNQGNVPVTVPSIGAVVLDDELAHCRALRGALTDVGDTMKTLDDFAAALGRRYRASYDTAALRVQNDEVTIEPGDTHAIALTIVLPDKLEPRSRHTGYTPISTSTLTFTVVPV